MRIVGGRHRGRPLKAPEGLDARPTADRTRESLFNLLEHGRLAREGSPLADAVVLDAFCGTGALALEALSRGAARAYGLDAGAPALDAARANAAALGEAAAFKAARGDALRPPPASEPASLVLMDPPYGKGMGAEAIAALDRAGWIAPGAVLSLETSAKERFEPPPGFTLEDERRYGRAKLWLMRRD